MCACMSVCVCTQTLPGEAAALVMAAAAGCRGFSSRGYEGEERRDQQHRPQQPSVSQNQMPVH